MSATNNVELIGRCCQDPEIRVDGDNTYGRVNVAVQRNFKNKDTDKYDADFITVEVSGTTAAFVEKYFHKGDAIVVRGWIKTGNYTNKDGVKVYTTTVKADEVAFAPGSKSDGESSNVASNEKPNMDFMKIPDNLPDDEVLPWN